MIAQGQRWNYLVIPIVSLVHHSKDLHGAIGFHMTPTTLVLRLLIEIALSIAWHAVYRQFPVSIRLFAAWSLCLAGQSSKPLVLEPSARRNARGGLDFPQHRWGLATFERISVLLNRIGRNLH